MPPILEWYHGCTVPLAISPRARSYLGYSFLVLHAVGMRELPIT